MVKKIGYSITVFLAVVFIFNPVIFASQVGGLSEIYDTSIPSEIRRNFNKYLQDRENYIDSEGEHGFINGEKFRDIYAKEFLVIGVEPNSFGGVWSVIAVKGEMRHAFRLWLYDIGTRTYDLRSIEEVPGCFDKQFIEKLCSPAYSNFWL